MQGLYLSSLHFNTAGAVAVLVFLAAATIAAFVRAYIANRHLRG